MTSILKFIPFIFVGFVLIGCDPCITELIIVKYPSVDSTEGAETKGEVQNIAAKYGLRMKTPNEKDVLPDSILTYYLEEIDDSFLSSGKLYKSLGLYVFHDPAKFEYTVYLVTYLTGHPHETEKRMRLISSDLASNLRAILGNTVHVFHDDLSHFKR